MVLDNIKIEKTYENTNLFNNNVKILVNRIYTPSKTVFYNTWKSYDVLNWTTYDIKETDMRVKTATFTSPTYLDLTTGVYCVLINTPNHENFAGIILSDEYDEETGLYTYQCQDWSRMYQSKFELITNGKSNLYRILQFLLTKGNISSKGKVSKSLLKKYKNTLSGLLPISLYNEKAWGNILNYNPMTVKPSAIIRDTSYIEAIRDLVHGSGSYIDVYFTDNGVLQLKPFNRDDWLSGELYLTTPEIASRKFKFDTTNIITAVIVNGDKAKSGTGFSSADLVGLSLKSFFGGNASSIKTETESTTKTVKQSVTTTKKEGTGIHVYMNTDNIRGKTADKKMMNDIASLLRKRGYAVTVGGVGSMTHYNDISKVKKNGIYFTMYGGRCAGTLKEQCYSSHYHNILKKRNARMVVGFYGKKLTDAFLPRAHDDNFSPSGFSGWSKPRTKLLNAGIGIAQGNTVKEVASTFPGFKTNNPKEQTTVKTTNKVITTQEVFNANKLQAEALEEIQESVRSLLTLKLTLPLGNPLLKNIHTNMFIWTELPQEFELANFGEISKVYQSGYSRYAGYVLNRWYVEGVHIQNNGDSATMELTLNPFPTSLLKYRDAKLKFYKAYTDATKNNTTNTSSKTSNKTNTSTTAQKRSDGKTDCYDTYYLATKSGRNNIKNLVNKSENKLAKQSIGKTGSNYHKFVKDCKTAKEIYKKLCTKIPQKVASYSNCKYKCCSDAFKHLGDLNCAERSRLFKACCDVQGILCVIYHVENHYLNGVMLNGKWHTVDLCYRAGITHKEFNSAGFNK